MPRGTTSDRTLTEITLFLWMRLKLLMLQTQSIKPRQECGNKKRFTYPSGCFLDIERVFESGQEEEAMDSRLGG